MMRGVCYAFDGALALSCYVAARCREKKEEKQLKKDSASKQHNSLTATPHRNHHFTTWHRTAPHGSKL